MNKIKTDKNGYFLTSKGIWQVRKEFHREYKNGYSNWEGTKNVVMWTVYDEKGEKVKDSVNFFSTRKEALEYYNPINFCYSCLQSKCFCECK